MGWPYRFVTLDDQQKHERRVALDIYANIAQSSTLTLLLLVQVYFLAAWIASRFSRNGREDVISSPRIKEERLGYWNGSRGWQATERKLQWWLGERVEIGGMFLGSRGQVALAVAWLAWLLCLCVPDTGDDYLHLTKRFGIVAASQLPIHYLLAFKSPFSPIQLLTRCSHETLNIYHQLLGRVIICLFLLHASFYLNFFIQSNLLATKVKELYIICGILGAWIFITIGTTALAPVRRWSYRVFYATHVILAMAWMLVLFFHVSHIRLYIYETAALFAINAGLRMMHSKTVTGTMKVIPDTNLLEIDVPISTESRHLQTFTPGQHAYLSLTNSSALKTYKSNPFSVSSIPSADGSLRFCARVLDGNTAHIAQLASATRTKHQIHIEGPYGVRDHAEKLLQYDRVLFVAGGVGATFVAPLYRQLLAELSPSRGSYRRQKVSFTWITKSMADMKWALPEDSKERDSFVERLKVYVTRASSGEDGSNLLRDEGDVDNGYAEAEEGIELQERQNLLSQDANGSASSKRESGLAAYGGRPDLRRLVDQMFSHASSEKVAVFVCGPGGLSQDLRREVGRWVSRGRDVWFWEEHFAL